jgi:hypothetical protein
MMKHALKVGVAVVFCATAIACGDDAGAGGSGGAAGVAGMTGGVSGAAGATGGTGGATGGAGGTTGGAGGTTGGVGGASGMTGGMGGMGGMPLSGDPTWSAIYSEIIMPKGCGQGAMCHGGGGGMLTLTDKAASYAALVGVDAMGMLAGFPLCSETGLKRVLPMDPDNSLLVQKLEGTQTCGVEMPPGGATLRISPDQQAQVRAWIMEGAMDN